MRPAGGAPSVLSARVARNTLIAETSARIAIRTAAALSAIVHAFTFGANFDEVLEMPSESWSPLFLALTLAGVFTMLLLGHWVVAAIFGGLALVVLAGWHTVEPQEA